MTKRPRSRKRIKIVYEQDDPLEVGSVLLQLLRHYAELGAEDRETWQMRLMDLDGLEPRELSRLHGELIAQGWVELNAGVTPGCYRVTLPGLRTFREIGANEQSE